MKPAIILLAAALVLATAVSCKREGAEGKPPAEDTSIPQGPVGISLRTYGRIDWVQDAREPLWLVVTLSNPQEVRVATANHQAKLLREIYEKKGLLDKMTPEQRRAFDEENKERTIPKIRLGAKGVALHLLVSFVVENSSGGALSVPVRVLASSDGIMGPAVLEGGQTLDFDFGIDPAALQTLPEGKYIITATFVPSIRLKGDEQPVEGQVRLVLKKQLKGLSRADQDQRDYLYGRFYLADRQWARADECAGRLLARDAKSVSGFELRADALAGQGKNAEAVRTFKQALSAFDAKYARDPKMEEPKYLNQRLRELEKPTK